jgi:hypothetical protein
MANIARQEQGAQGCRQGEYRRRHRRRVQDVLAGDDEFAPEGHGQAGQDLDVYIATVKKKYPAFEAVVTKELKKKADAHLRFVSDEIKAKTEYYPRYSGVQTAYKDLTAGKGKPKDVAKAMERLLGCLATFALVEPDNWDKKRQGLNRIMSEFERADALTDGHRQVFTKLMTDLKP